MPIRFTELSDPVFVARREAELGCTLDPPRTGTVLGYDTDGILALVEWDGLTGDNQEWYPVNCMVIAQ